MKSALSWVFLVILAPTLFVRARDDALIDKMPAKIDAAINRAIETDTIPGAVVLVGHEGKSIYLKAYGNRSISPTHEAMTADTIFDLASLTKPIVTATSIMILIDRGQLKLSGRLGQLLPEFDNGGKGSITLEQLLRHRTGLIADNPLSDYSDGPAEAWKRLATLKTLTKPGEKFLYSDVNFIILGKIVETVSKQPLDVFAQKQIFEPLGMKNSGFRHKNDPESLPRIAPTEPDNSVMLRGIVHDPRARLLGGVAGHAGLFGTAEDLARFCTMMLNEGKGGDGQRILSQKSVQQMTSPGETTSPQARGLGWDIITPFSSPRGRSFGPKGFGHTGFTGTSLWLDLETRTFVILLTSRLHPDGKAPSPLALRSEIATIVGECMKESAKQR
jgi:CubicO group peptidase (beta-lactamase class C family)